MNELDFDKNKQISFSEFLAATLDVKKFMNQQKLDSLFN